MVQNVSANHGSRDRRTDDELRAFIDSKVKELDDRRESNLKFKLEAIEKLFITTLETKSSALAIAVSRIQCENSGCLARCRDQVSTFYSMIHDIKEADIRREMIVSTVTDTLTTLTREIDSLDAEVAKLVDFNELDSEVTAYKQRIEELESWKALDLKRSIIIAVVSFCTTIVTMVPVAVYLYDKFTDRGL